MIKTLKFGGTSVGSAENMRKVSDVVRSENARITVLSAMSGTTDGLVKICAEAKKGEKSDATIAMLLEKYTNCISELLTSRRMEALDKMSTAFSVIQQQSERFRCGYSDKLIIAQGELLTSAIFCMYMQEQGYDARLLNAPDFMVTDADGKVDIPLLNSRLRELVAAAPESAYFITQGFICTNYQGDIDNLGRGGSDYSAAMMGVSIGASEVQIWTDIDGMHNNDPRYVEKTYPIREMSFDEAAELAYFGAKILHPSTIQPCKEAGVAVRLKNTLDPSAAGTLITDKIDDENKSFHAVAAKDGITVVRITSARMLMAYGFLRKVFEIFEKFRTPIDMITTSEVAVSLTIDNAENIDEIVHELQELGHIEVESDHSIVCVVGRMQYDYAGLAAKIFGSMNEIPVKMISYGASHRSMSFLISTCKKRETLQALSKGLF